MIVRNLFLAIGASLLALAPAFAQESNDYAPSSSPSTRLPSPVPPPSLENLERGGGERPGMEKLRQKMMARFDSDGDGVLSDNERAKAEAFRAQRKQQRMGGRNRQGQSLGAGLQGQSFANGAQGQGFGGGRNRGAGRKVNPFETGEGLGPGGPGFETPPEMAGNPDSPPERGFRGPDGAGGFRGGFAQGGQGNKEARRQKMMQRFDSNGDGEIDEREASAMKAFVQQRRQQRMQQGGN